jgi:hypothetical protein
MLAWLIKLINTRLTYTYRFADLDNIYQRANRFRLSGYVLQQHAHGTKK